jgi:tRNA threonylcarbamoyladenosine biosynthesis protein TsaB
VTGPQQRAAGGAGGAGDPARTVLVDGGVAVAIETATETVGVAVRTAAGVRAELSLTGRRRHVEALAPALDHLLVQVGRTPAEVSVVAVDLGPGLFTGLRVGVAAAKALALARGVGVGVVGVSSLEVLAAAAAAIGHRGPVLSCVDARRGEVFAALYAPAEAGPVPPVLGPALFAPQELAAALGRLDGSALQAVGDGAQRYAAELAAVPSLEVVAPGLAFPPPGTLLDVALARVGSGEVPAEPGRVVPLYLREADARVNFARADRPAR